MTRQIISDKTEDQGEVALKRLGSPKKSTVVDRSTSVDDDDVSHLNDGGGANSSRPTSTRETANRTVIGNQGVGANGKIDFSVNPDCVDYILQEHESSGNSDDEDGFLETGTKSASKFNRLFSTKTRPCKVTPEDIAAALAKVVVPGAPKTPKAEAALPEQRGRPVKVPTKSVTFFKLPETKSLKIASEGAKVSLSGEKFEICKILNCKSICVMQKTNGSIDENSVFQAACANSENGEILEGCPQEKPMDTKEQMLFEILKAQCGDEIQAKKFLFITKHVK